MCKRFVIINNNLNIILLIKFSINISHINLKQINLLIYLYSQKAKLKKTQTKYTTIKFPFSTIPFYSTYPKPNKQALHYKHLYTYSTKYFPFPKIPNKYPIYPQINHFNTPSYIKILAPSKSVPKLSK